MDICAKCKKLLPIYEFEEETKEPVRVRWECKRHYDTYPWENGCHDFEDITVKEEAE